MLTKPGSPFKFYDPHRPIFTHPRFLPGSRLVDCARARRDRRRGLLSRPAARSRNRSSASARTCSRARRSAARCCSAPTTTKPTMPRRRAATRPRLGIGRNVVLDRVIVDKNARIGDGARLVNEQGRRRMPTATATTSATASSSCRRTASSSRERWSESTGQRSATRQASGLRRRSDRRLRLNCVPLRLRQLTLP